MKFSYKNNMTPRHIYDNAYHYIDDLVQDSGRSIPNAWPQSCAKPSTWRYNCVFVCVILIFRYHAAVRKMLEIIKENGGVVRALSAFYYLAYPELDRPFWWDCRHSGGPIVEQATHLCDVARFLGGEIIEDSIRGISQKPCHGGSDLKKIPAGCDVGVPEGERVPRATMATWRFQSGGIGSVCHTVALHGEAYEAYMDVILEGIRMRLLDPYGSTARLEVRGLAEDPEEEQVFHFGDCDPYKGELEAFFKAVRTGDAGMIVSPYKDAAKTYLMTWAIRYACEWWNGEVNLWMKKHCLEFVYEKTLFGVCFVRS